jgi:hypothetical protein
VTNPQAAKPAGSWLYPNGDPILYTGVLIALDHATCAIVYRRKLPTSANAPIAIAGNSVLVPAGGPDVFGPKGGSPQLVVCTVR